MFQKEMYIKPHILQISRYCDLRLKVTITEEIYIYIILQFFCCYFLSALIYINSFDHFIGSIHLSTNQLIKALY